MAAAQLQLSDRVVNLHHAFVRVGEGEDATTLPLTQSEVAALRYLGERANEAVSREELERRVWGFRAGVRSEAVPVAMRRLRQKLEPDPGEPRHLFTVQGVGWRLVAEVAAAEEPAPDASLSPAPVWLDGFVPRPREQAMLEEALQRGRLVSVVGPGGVGKTRLVAELARGATLPVAFAALADAPSRSEAGLRVCASLGLSGEDGDAASVGAVLDGAGPLLLLLDTTEHLDGLGLDVAAWLAAAPGLRVLTTGRRPLRVSGEQLVPLHPLDEAAGVALFLQRARAVDPWSDLDAPASREAVRRLVGLLDGIPQALELAAARLPVFEVKDLLARDNLHLDLLQGDHGDTRRETRQGTVERTLRWSWSLLEPWAREALVELSAFEGAFEVEDAEDLVCGDGGGPTPVDRVLHLVEHSLVVARHDSRPRLSLLASVRAFARQEGAPALLRQARDRHARWAARFGAVEAVRRAEVDVGARSRRVAALADLHVAAVHALATGQADLALDCAVAAAEVRRQVGPAALGLQLIEAVAAALAPERPSRLDLAAARLADRAGRGTEARALADRAVGAARTDGERLDALLTAAWLRQQASYPELEALARQGLELATATGDAHREAGFLRLLIEGARVRGDLDAAESLAGRALDLIREAGDGPGEVRVLVNLGNLRAAGGDLEGALAALQRAVHLLRGAGQPVALASALMNSGIAHARHGRAQEAMALLDEALALARRVADRRLEALCLANLGRLHVLRGAPAEAEEGLRRAISLAERGGWRGVEHDARGSLAEVLLSRGRLEAALAQLDLAAEGMAAVGYRSNALDLLTRAAELWQEAGDPAEARSRVDRGLALAQALGEAGRACATRLAAVRAWAGPAQ